MGVPLGKESSTPDPYATSAAQTASNQQTANYNADLNRVNTFTPYGSSVYSQTGTGSSGAPTYQQDITLTPLAQQQLNDQLQQNADLSKLGYGLYGQAQNSLANPVNGNNLPSLAYGANGGSVQTGLNTSGVSALPNSADFASQMKQAQNASFDQAKSYLDPQYAEAQSNLDAKLSNQGVMQGSDAYTRAQGDLSRQRAFAYNQAQDSAIATGNALQQQLFGQGVTANQAGMSNAATSGNFANSAQAQQYGQALQNAGLNNQARGQGLTEQATLASLPLNELNALRSGTQIQNPQFQSTYQSTASPTDVSGNVYKSAQMANANQSNFMNGLFSLGSAAIMASDRRLKRDIERIGETAMGLPLYAFRYVWGGAVRVGVMAQDVLKVCPDAVITKDGFMAVNYAALT